MHSDNRFTLRQLQKENAEWANANFDTSVLYHPLLGALEEYGELCHAILKKEQGIRGSGEQHMQDAKDAVGDIVIYLADLCNRLDIEMPVTLFGKNRYSDSLRYLFNVSKELGVICDTFNDSLTHTLQIITSAQIVKILDNLNYFCCCLDWDFMRIVEDTWTEVSGRNWKENPTLGVSGD